MKIHRRTRAGLVIVATLLLAPGAWADEEPALLSGMRVRITGGISSNFLGSTTGVLVSRGPDAITVVTKEGMVTLPTESVTRIELSHGRRSHGRLGLLVGLGAGALIGLALTYDPDVACGVDYYVPCTTSRRVANTVSGAVGFGVVGTVLGRRLYSETWSDAPLGRLRVAVVPERHGGRVAFALSF